mgnify:FL=1
MRQTLVLILLFVLFSLTPETMIVAQSPVSSWSYIEVDSAKSKWGDYAEPQWLRYFGLDAGDVNGDGARDILSGRWIYLNPGGNMAVSYTHLTLPTTPY